jgi:hypothetical protein
MIELIQSIDGWQAKTPQEIADLLNTKSVPKTDNQLYTYAGLIDKLTQEPGLAFRATMRHFGDKTNPGNLPPELFEPLNFAHDRLTTGGLDLSRHEVQYMLDELAVIPQLAPFVEPIKLIGRWSVSPMENAGLEPATIEQVETALETIQKVQLVSDARSSVNAKATAVNAWLDVLDVAELTVAQVHDYVQSLLSSDDGNPTPTQGG